MPEAAHSFSLKSSCNSSGTNGFLHSGHVFRSWSIQRSTQHRWNMCRQFLIRRISSSSSNSYRQTAQPSGRSDSSGPASARISAYVTAGSISRMRAPAEEIPCIGPGSGWSSSLPGSTKEERPRRRRRERTSLRTKPKSERVVRRSLGRSTSVYPAGNPISSVVIRVVV